MKYRVDQSCFKGNLRGWLGIDLACCERSITLSSLFSLPSQSDPLNPEEQIHSYPSLISLHVPPF